jgi:hypothetical protein
MSVSRYVLPVLLLGLLVSAQAAAAINWWAVAGSTALGAGTGAYIGSFFGPLGELAGAGVGALAGFLGSTLVQLLGTEPTSSTNASDWRAFAYNALNTFSQEAELVIDNQVTQVKLIQEAQMPFVLTAQKWEQVNYNVNTPPSDPYQFYRLMQDTGFLSYAAKLVGGTQSLWIVLSEQVKQVNNQMAPYAYRITFNPPPDAVAQVTYQANTMVVVVGNVTVLYTGTVYSVTPNGPQVLNRTAAQTYLSLKTGAYLFDSGGFIYVDPHYGMVLVFKVSGANVTGPYGNAAYTPIDWTYNVPTVVYLYSGSSPIANRTLPTLPSHLPLVVEQLAVSMLGAAMVEYTTLKTMGYTNASQIPSTMTLPTIQLNLGNYSNFTSSLEAYNLYLAMYVRQLLQVQATLQQLSQQGRLAGLQQLSFNVTSPVQLYGKYGGFVFNGSLILPNSTTLTGAFLIQPYGGPLTLNATGGVVGNGGAVAYQLIAVGNGSYALGQIYTLPPGTKVVGNVVNPGTLGTVNPPPQQYYYTTQNYTAPSNASSSSWSAAIHNLGKYFAAHPVALLLTIAFVLVVVVVLVRSLAK